MILTIDRGKLGKWDGAFQPGELACKGKGCCTINSIDSRLLDCLNELRASMQMPIIVNSGFRCPRHNREVGGRKGSYHMQGMAADIRLDDSAGAGDFEDLKAEAMAIFGYMYVGQGFIHVDIRSKKG